MSVNRRWAFFQAVWKAGDVIWYCTLILLAVGAFWHFEFVPIWIAICMLTIILLVVVAEITYRYKLIIKGY